MKKQNLEVFFNTSEVVLLQKLLKTYQIKLNFFQKIVIIETV